MQQVRVHGPGDVRVDEVPEPEPGPDDVVRVAACGICRSDLSYIAMGGLAGPGREPMCLGHELSGTVDWVGADVTTARVGDRVVVHPGDDQLGRIGNGGAQGGLTPLLLVAQADRGHDLAGVLTHRFRLDDFDEALALLEGSKDCGKVLVTIDPTQP